MVNLAKAYNCGKQESDNVITRRKETTAGEHQLSNLFSNVLLRSYLNLEKNCFLYDKTIDLNQEKDKKRMDVQNTRQ